MQQQLGMSLEISIHAPREGCDAQTATLYNTAWEFQSTHPVRGATKLGDKNDSVTVFQSTHPVRGATAKVHKMHRAFCDKT